jgi:predicted enzyme related to lactoylglutathione lyase
MASIIGMGGVFLKARDPQALASWYQEKLGIPFNGSPYTSFQFTDNDGKITPGYNVLSFFKTNSGYFDPSQKSTMLNLRVDDLVVFIQELREKQVTMVGDMVDGEYGKFAWILDPDDNKIELWEPPAT